MTNAGVWESTSWLTDPDRLPTSAETLQGADVLARGSVTQAANFVKLRRRILRVRDTRVSAAAVPLWISSVRKGVRRLLELEAGWDTYGAPPISTEAIKAAMRVLFSVAGRETLPPTIVPTSAGGCQLEWHSEMVDIEIECSPTGDTSLFMQHQPSGQIWEGGVEEHVAYIRRFLDLLLAEFDGQR